MFKDLPIEIYHYIKDMSYSKDNIGRSDDSIYTFNGKHIGWFINGWILDRK